MEIEIEHLVDGCGLEPQAALRVLERFGKEVLSVEELESWIAYGKSVQDGGN